MTKRETDSPTGGKRPKLTGDRFQWHRCWHDRALAGVRGLSIEAKGVYIVLIWLCYSQRGPLPDDDVMLARLCEIDVRKFRRIKAELLAAQRIAHDPEARTIYDERAIRELVAAGIFSEAQERRSSRPRKGRPRLAVNNVVDKPKPAEDRPYDSADDRPQLPVDHSPVSQGNQGPESSQERREESYSSAGSSTPHRRAALPPKGGGAPVAPKLDGLGPADRQKLIETFAQALNAGPPPGDRKAKRT